MYCRTCGKEINDNAVICPHCGCATGNAPNVPFEQRNKKTTGILLGLFLGIIGLIIGVCIYPSQTIERDTFMKGWGIGFLIAIGIEIVSGIILGATLSAFFSSIFSYV